MPNYQIDVLVIAPLSDPHARAVQREIRSIGHSCLILDSKSYPLNVSLTLRSDGRATSIHFAAAAKEIDWTISESTGVWWRRPRGHTMGAFHHPKVLGFAAAENSLAFHGSLAHCCRIFVNPLTAQYPTTKLYELGLAAELGLRVPDTLVTTNPEDAARFVSAPGRRYIHKVLRGGGGVGACYTRLFEDADLNDLARIQRCPVMLQEFIPAVADLRATIVGHQVFCASTRLGPDSPIDGRLNKVRANAYELPPAIARALVQLTRARGLVYGAIDLRLTETGEVVFLEVNPDGQYLWLEVDAGLPITAALARLLLSDVHPQPSEDETSSSSNAVRPWELVGLSE